MTHAGTWDLFRDAFVVAERFDQALFKAGAATQAIREAADYHAREPDPEAPREILREAERFVAAVIETLSASE